MREKKQSLIISFVSTTDAMAAERCCTGNGLDGRLIPLPGEISAGCGLAWKCRVGDGAKTAELIMAAGIKISGTHILML